jgi:O-succinylbenzoate synthase
MKFERVTLHLLNLRLKTPFVTSYGVHDERRTILVEAADADGLTGWGECVAFDTPHYTEETVDTAWLILERFLIPAVLGVELAHPAEIARRLQPVRRHPMAKAGLETAGWDLYCKRAGIPLHQALGGVRREVDSGAAVGLQDSDAALYRAIDRCVADGYRRVKLKIKPGADVDLLARVRARFPDLPLMADANSAYTLADAEHLRALDAFGLMMIEQPLGEDDIVDHAELQRRLRTPICLDESIVSAADARKALQLGSCGVINIKIGRVGGLAEAKNIHDLCAERGVPVWCGGMLETGIGRAHNLALATLPGFTLPADLSASSRYWDRDVIVPEITVRDGRIRVPDGPGIGFEVDREFIASVTERKQTYRVR